jgi:hypothetical protein
MQLDQAHGMQQPDVWLPVPTFGPGSRGAKKSHLARLCKYEEIERFPAVRLARYTRCMRRGYARQKKKIVIGSAPDQATKQRLGVFTSRKVVEKLL